jgi:hypothetical protein
MVKFIFVAACGLLLSACATRQYKPEVHYVAPAGTVPPATLHSKLPTGLGRHDSMSLQVLNDQSCERQRLFSVSEYSKATDPVKPIPIAAGELIALRYEGTLPGNRTCTIYAGAIFESGKSYSLYAGNNRQENFVDFFKNRTCAFSIVDDATKQPLQLLDKTGICGR